ncbi:MAG: zf-HC2 domain-containing protein [Longimicrobiales bacterium]|nr:zf-HC2 domain-containing protein [Longimicrobiales bacterium]
MSERFSHPSTERLEAFVEEALDGADRAVVDSHLTRCSDCQAEVAELRTLFAALGDLPELEPSAGFADRVMERVRVRQPVLAAASAWLDRVTPQSTRGWAAAAAVFALPVIGTTVLVAWLLAQPGVSAQGLWTFGTALVGDAVVVGAQWVWTQLSSSTLAVWAAQAAEVVGTAGAGQVGLALVMFATLTAGSIYVLYQNLFRPQQQRRIEHASYVI